MTMPLDTVPTLIALGGAVAAGVSGLGGLIKFRAWWKDRALSARIESATALAEKGSADWQKTLGQRLLARAHFARLTGIDVPDGHPSLLALHEQLGGTDAQLGMIRRSIRRLDRRVPCAQPRAMSRRDWFTAFGSAFFCLIFAALAFALVGMVAVAMDRVNWNLPVPASKLMAFVVGGLYAASTALFAGFLFKAVDSYIAASHIRQMLRKQLSE